jgi:glycopeptide antibiotics resistance protein
LGLLLAMLLTTFRPSVSRRTVYLLIPAVCFCFAGALELSQSICIERFVDITDPFLDAFGSVVGISLLRLLGRRST